MSLSQRIRPNSEAAPWVVEEVKELEQELSDLRATLDLVYSANHCAIKTWQKAHPEHHDMVWPDQAALVGWLLEERRRLRTSLENIANMPRYDQDDAHRLRHKAQTALQS